MKKAAVLFCALFLVICVLAVFSAAAEDEVRSERTVLVDEEGILLVAEESTVKTGRRNSPYIQFTLQNNTDQELFIALNGTVNGYNTRIGLSPQDSTQSLESIRPGETLSGDLIFTSQYDEYMGGTNVSEFTVASFFGRMDEIDRKTGYPKLYYESGPVTIPCSGDYTPPESWIPFCENDMFRLTAVDRFLQEPLTPEMQPEACMIWLMENKTDGDVVLGFTDLVVNGIQAGNDTLRISDSYSFTPGHRGFSAVRLVNSAQLGIEEIRTLTGTISGYATVPTEDGKGIDHYEKIEDIPFEISFEVSMPR